MSYIFQIVDPVTMTINGDTFKDAVKNFVKMNHDMTITSLILTDRSRYMRANLNFYRESNKHKVGISLYPTVWPLNSINNSSKPISMWPYLPSINYDTEEYPSTTFINGFVPQIVPLIPTLDPLGTSLYSPLGTSLYSPLGTSVYPPLGTSVYSPLGTSVYSPLGTSVYSPLSPSLYSPLGTSVYSPLVGVSYNY